MNNHSRGGALPMNRVTAFGLGLSLILLPGTGRHTLARAAQQDAAPPLEKPAGAPGDNGALVPDPPPANPPGENAEPPRANADADQPVKAVADQPVKALTDGPVHEAFISPAK